MLMAVMMPREKWTDERLDDSFERIGKNARELRAEMNARFNAVDARFNALDARFDALNRNLLIVAGTIIAALIGSAATLIGIAAL